jgi:hypothetical protein
MVVVFTEEERRGWVNPFLTSVLMRFAFDQRIRVTYAPIHAIHPVSAARNRAVQAFLATDADVLVMIDNDVAPPINVVDSILTMPTECDVVVLPYWVWLPKERHTMPCFGQWQDGAMITPDPDTLVEGWNEMGSGGTGCMFVRRKVFTDGKLPEPFFHIINDARKGQVVSEDIYFTARATEAGYRLFTNTDFICSHYRTIDLAEVNMGIVQVTRRFYKALTDKYGELKGVTPDTLIRELHPELTKAAEAVRQETKSAEAAESK